MTEECKKRLFTSSSLLNFCKKPEFKRFLYVITKEKISVVISVNLPAVWQAGLWLSRQ